MKRTLWGMSVFSVSNNESSVEQDEVFPAPVLTPFAGIPIIEYELRTWIRERINVGVFQRLRMALVTLLCSRPGEPYLR
jgi:hypothetical protein